MNFLAIDLGATSGRSVLATYDDGRISMRQLTRFDNPQIPVGGHLYWDLPHLYNEVLKALQTVAAEDIQLQSIGIDTWGCDFAFFGRDGQLLGLPHCYRDAYTDGAMERYWDQCMPAAELYARTGIQFMPFNSLFQLYTQQQLGHLAFSHADKILFMPDALIRMLTGESVCEYTVASTSQMLNPQTGDLDADILCTLNLPRERFGRLVQPGTVVGSLTTQVQRATGLGPIPVVAVGSHDTASAVAAVPTQDAHYAYLSCGTWSLLGVESSHAVINDDSYAQNFTNEGGLDGTTRFLKNICGLWIFEQCRKEWNRTGAVPQDVNVLNALCLESECASLIQPDDPLFAHPDSMTQAIDTFLHRTGQALPQTPADYVRVIFRSLAARYAEVIQMLHDLSDVDIQRLHVIGGGSLNSHLMRFTAQALGIPVIAGPAEGTALGNAMVQVRASHLVDTLADMRAVISRSIELTTYTA